MPRLHDGLVSSTLYAGRGGRPDGPLHPVVSQKLEAAIQNCNAVNAQGLRDFCDHAEPKEALALFEKGEKYWINLAGDVQLFLKTQAAEALAAISQAKDVEAAVRAVGAIQNVIGSHLGVHFFETKQYLNQSKLQVQEGKVLVIELLCALRNNKFNSIKDPEDSLTAAEIYKALTAVAKASGVAPRVEINFQRVPARRDVVPVTHLIDVMGVRASLAIISIPHR
jgi:hypothetical protein